MLTNAADPDEEWVRGFLLRLGYLLAAEYHLMPECELRDIVGNASAEMVNIAEAAEPVRESPTLRIVD